MAALPRKRRRVCVSGCNREMAVFTLISILKRVTALRATSERRGSGEWNSCDSVSLSPVGLTGGVGWRRLTAAYLLSPEWRDRVIPPVLCIGALQLGVLEHDRCAVGDDLDHLVTDLGTVEAHPNDRGRPKFFSRSPHPRERLAATRGEQVPILVERTAIPERVQAGHDVAGDTATPDGDADDDTERHGDVCARDSVRRRDADGGIVSCAHVRWGRTLCRRCIARSFRGVRPIHVVPPGDSTTLEGRDHAHIVPGGLTAGLISRGGHLPAPSSPY